MNHVISHPNRLPPCNLRILGPCFSSYFACSFANNFNCPHNRKTKQLIIRL